MDRSHGVLKAWVVRGTPHSFFFSLMIPSNFNFFFFFLFVIT